MDAQHSRCKFYQIPPRAALMLMLVLFFGAQLAASSFGELFRIDTKETQTTSGGSNGLRRVPVSVPFDHPLPVKPLQLLKHRRRGLSAATAKSPPPSPSPPLPPPNRTDAGCADVKAMPCAWWKASGYCSPYHYYQSEDKRVRDYWCPQTCGLCGSIWPQDRPLMNQGQQQNQSLLVSPSGAYRLELRTDGNLVVINVNSSISSSTDGASAATSSTVWDLRREDAWPTSVLGPYKLVLQSANGNLELSGAGGAVVWRTRLGSVPPGPYTLVLQDDGHLELVAGSSVVLGAVYWSSSCPVVPALYTFLPLKDHTGSGTLGRAANISSAATACYNDCRCKGFNSAGSLKSTVDINANFTCSCCGLYVRDIDITCLVTRPSPPSPPPPSPPPKASKPPSPLQPRSPPPAPRPRSPPSPQPRPPKPRSPSPPPSPRPPPPPSPRPQPPPAPPLPPPSSPLPPPYPISQGCVDPSAALNLHNTYRRRHGAANLTWDDTLKLHAQAWALHLASSGCVLSHTTDFSEGENLYGTGYYAPSGGAPPPRLNCSIAVEGWYEGNRFYDFGASQPLAANRDRGLGTFTQVVWGATRRLGCAAASGDACYVVVCRYSPPGNVASEDSYRQNVLPPLT